MNDKKNGKKGDVEVGKRLKLARDLLGLNQVDFCDKVGIKQSNLSSIENGTRPIGLKLMEQIRDRANIRVEYLVNGVGEIFHGHISPSDKVKAILRMERMEPIGMASIIGYEFSGEILDVVTKGTEPSDELMMVINESFPQYDKLLSEDGNDKHVRNVSVSVPIIPDSVHSNIKGFVNSPSFGRVSRLICNFMEHEDGVYVKNVVGNAMEPAFIAGDKILIKDVGLDAYIKWNHAYLLDTKQGLVLCNPMPNDGGSSVTCSFLDPKYPPFNVNFDCILGLYLVVGTFRYK